MPRGIGLDLGPVQSDPADFDQSGRGTQAEHLDEEPFEGLEVNLAEVTDGAEIGNVLGHEDAAGHIGEAAGLNPARGEGAGAIAVEQQADHQAGMEGRQGDCAMMGSLG